MNPSQLFFGEMRGASMLAEVATHQIRERVVRPHAAENAAHEHATPNARQRHAYQNKARKQQARVCRAENDTPTSPTRARMKKTYHTSSATSSAPVTRSEPESPQLPHADGICHRSQRAKKLIGQLRIASQHEEQFTRANARKHAQHNDARQIAHERKRHRKHHVHDARAESHLQVGRMLELIGRFAIRECLRGVFFATAVCTTCS